MTKQCGEQVTLACPRVSIIVCTFNREAELHACLNSLFEQDYPECEIIVVDDGSTDATKQRLEAYRSRPDTLIICNQINRGVSGARNVGIRHATGDIVAFTDDDCIASKNWISELVKGFRIDEGIVMVGGRVDDAVPANIFGVAAKGLYYISDQDSFDRLPTGGNLACQRAYALENEFDETLKYGADDYDFCQTCLEKGHKIYFRHSASTLHRHRTTFRGLIRQRYLVGMTLIWFRRKHHMSLMHLKPSFLMGALVMMPVALFHRAFLLISLFFLMLFCAAVVYEDLRRKAKTPMEMGMTFPIMVCIYGAEFAGVLHGLAKYGLLERACPSKERFKDG